MVKLLFIFIFLPLFCQSQGYIGWKTPDLKSDFSKRQQKLEDSTKAKIPFMQYEEEGGIVRLFVAKDTVSYYQIYRQSVPKVLNKTKQFYDENLYPIEKWLWVNHAPDGSYMYQCNFPSKEIFVTTVQKMK